MEFHSRSKIFHPHHPEEKQQMLNLNRRLETYLSRVKLLEEENAMLAKEIQTMRHNNQGASMQRRGLEDELQQARLDVDAAWRDRVLAEVEIHKLTEELQVLTLQRQREAQARVMAKKNLEQSRKELEEEHRAQIWLRGKVDQLEHEMRLLIQTHEEDVAHLEVVLTQSRDATPQRLAQRGSRAPDLLKMGQELSQKATRVWQEAAEAYQGQLAQLEESLDQARSRLNQVGQEKLESQLKIQVLEKEIASAQDVRLHLEKTGAQKRDRHCLELQQLQEHLESLEVEKGELGQQIAHLLRENRGLLQLKMSLGLEVSTYRALLDNESLRGDASLLNKPRNAPIADAVRSPRGVTKNYKTQLPANRSTIFPSSVYGVTAPTLTTATPYGTRKPVTLNETTQILREPAYTTQSMMVETSYPKIIQDGAEENFRPQEVHEKVTHAEPLSPPNEQETPEDKDEDKRSVVDAEVPAEEVVFSRKSESDLNSEPCFDEKPGLHPFTTPNLISPSVSAAEETFSSSDELDQDVADAVFHKTSQPEDESAQEGMDQTLEGCAEKGETQQGHALADASIEVEHVDKEEEEEEKEHVEEEITITERQVLHESTTEPLKSEGEHVESVFNNDGASDGAAGIREDLSGLAAEVNGVKVERLYPDGEEMDTWDSVIEKKVDVGTVDGDNNEGKKPHAEPEDDISTKEPADKTRSSGQDDHAACSPVSTQLEDRWHTVSDLEQAPPPDKEEEEEDDEDSQNVSVSWRTELESDSYALDNTLADTRPLIRYKSDETDGNAQQIDESESSEGEQEKKAKEAGTGTWSDGKSKTFGTMEDLCEEVEEETIDDNYVMGYTQDRDFSQSTVVSACMTAENDTEKADEMMRNNSEGHSEEETEELGRPMGRTYVHYDEELETDKLVEQELEDLSTDSYSARFAQRQLGDETPLLEDESIQEVIEKEKDTSSCEPDESVNDKLVSSTTVLDQASENPPVTSDSRMLEPPTDVVTEEDVVHRLVEEEDDPNRPVVMCPDVTGHCGLDDMGPNSALPQAADEQNMVKVAVPRDVTEEEERSYESHGHLVGHAEDFHGICEDEEMVECEVLENSTTDPDHRCNNQEEVAVMHQEKLVESAAGENDSYIVTDATDSAHHHRFPSGVKADFWVSSLENSVTCEQEDPFNEAAEQTYQDQGHTWEDLQNPSVVNGNSRVHDDSPKAWESGAEPGRAHAEKRKFNDNVVEGEMFHSEESEIEAGSWSSGE